MKNWKILYTVAYSKDIISCVGQLRSITLKCIPKEIMKAQCSFAEIYFYHLG